MHIAQIQNINSHFSDFAASLTSKSEELYDSIPMSIKRIIPSHFVNIAFKRGKLLGS